MKALSCKQPGLFNYIKRKEPLVKKEHAVLKVKSIGICGTEIHAFEGTQSYFDYPRILGHELTTSEKIVKMTVFLLSPVSSHTTGQLIYVDGGYVHLDRAMANA